MSNRFGYMPAVIHTIGSDGKTVPVGSSNPLPTSSSGGSGGETNLVSTVNSSSAALLADQSFTGTGEDILAYGTIIVSVYSNVDSATGGLEFQFSTDNTNWFTTDQYTYDCNGKKSYTLQRTARYFRVKYTNGSENQTAFELGVIYNASPVVASSHRIGDVICNDDDAQLTKAVLSAQKVTGNQTNIQATAEGALITSVVTPTGVLPVAQNTTLRDGKTLGRLFPELNEIVGTGTATFQTNKYDLAVDDSEYLVYTSRHFLPYFSGKPQKVELTFDKFAPQTDVVKRVGYFSSGTTAPYGTTFDGFYLESSNNTIKFVIENNGTKVHEVDITEWTNYEEMNSYQSLATWDNFTVIEFNFLWLGGAYIEIRLVTSVGFTTVHQFIYAGHSQDVFLQSPNQPVRYEIRSTGGTGAFRAICNQVATSGSIEESALSRAVTNGTTAINIATVGTVYPIIAVRKQASLRFNPVRIQACNIFVPTNDRVLWSLQINPTLSAPLSYSAVANSSVEYAVGNGTITVTSPGTVIESDYLPQNARIPTELFVNNYLSWLSGSITGAQDQYVLCASPLTTNVDAYGSISIFEG